VAGSTFWGTQTQGWSQDLYPRALADVGAGANPQADYVGFASNGVWVSGANGTGGINPQVLAKVVKFAGVKAD
jgi:hypothetical protein